MVIDPKQKRRKRIAQKLADKRTKPQRNEGKGKYIRKGKYGTIYRASEEGLPND